MSSAVAYRESGHPRPLELGKLLRYGLAVSSAGGALIHFSAAGDHSSQRFEAALFMGAAVAQLAWAAVILRRTSRLLLGLGAVFSLVLVACWAVSRTTGLPLGVGRIEPLGWKDSIAVLLEVAIVAGTGLLALLPAAGRELVVPAGRLAFHTTLITVTALTVTALVFAGGHGTGGPGELAGDHHAGAELASEHYARGATGHEADATRHEAEPTGHVAEGHQAGAAAHVDDANGTDTSEDAHASHGTFGTLDASGAAAPDGHADHVPAAAHHSGHGGMATAAGDVDHSAHGAPGAGGAAPSAPGGAPSEPGEPVDHSAHGDSSGESGSSDQPAEQADGHGAHERDNPAPGDGSAGDEPGRGDQKGILGRLIGLIEQLRTDGLGSGASAS